MEKKKLTNAQLTKLGREAIKLFDDNSEYARDHIWFILGEIIEKMRGKNELPNL